MTEYLGESYAKLLSSITDSSVWDEDNETRIVWITLMAMANKYGYVGASVPGIARRARVPIEAVEVALGKFQSPDPHSRSPEFEGRRVERVERGWLLLNYTRIRTSDPREAAREYERIRKANQRGRTVPDSPGHQGQPGTIADSHVSASASGVGVCSDREGVQGEGLPPRRVVTSYADALELDPEARARLVIANPHDGAWLEPHRWPEVVAVAAALGEVTGAKVRLSAYRGDRGVQGIVAMLADGFPAGDLVRAAKLAAGSPWWRKGKRGLSSLTPEVVRRALDPSTPQGESARVKGAPPQGDHGREGTEKMRRL
jgi:hypothetical protein